MGTTTLKTIELDVALGGGTDSYKVWASPLVYINTQLFVNE